MSNIVESYRRAHVNEKRPPSRRWSLALAGLGALVVCGFMLLQLLAAVTAPDGPAFRPTQDSTLAHPPATVARSNAANDLVIGSTSKLQPQPATKIPGLGVVSVAIGLLTGLMVYFALNHLMPAKDPEANDGVQMAKLLNDKAQVRRYHGGPIRD